MSCRYRSEIAVGVVYSRNVQAEYEHAERRAPLPHRHPRRGLAARPSPEALA